MPILDCFIFILFRGELCIGSHPSTVCHKICEASMAAYRLIEPIISNWLHWGFSQVRMTKGYKETTLGDLNFSSSVSSVFNQRPV